MAPAITALSGAPGAARRRVIVSTRRKDDFPIGADTRRLGTQKLVEIGGDDPTALTQSG